jgi:hypothetical protein
VTVGGCFHFCCAHVGVYFRWFYDDLDLYLWWRIEKLDLIRHLFVFICIYASISFCETKGSSSIHTQIMSFKCFLFVFEKEKIITQVMHACTHHLIWTCLNILFPASYVRLITLIF